MNNIVTTNTNTEVVVVTAPGPSGPPGPTGPIGEPGTIQTNSGTIVSPFLIVDGFVVITGSLTVSGSNTFRNIGPALFTGSTGILGNLTVDGTSSATVFSGSGALLTGIPSTGITGLNLSRVATGSISASVNTGTTSFTLNNGGTNLFTVSNTGLGTFTNGLTVSGAVANLNNGLNVSVGNTVINSPNIQLIGSATLNGQPITTAGDLTLDKIKSGVVTASVSTGPDAFTLESAGTPLFKVSNTGILSGSGANLFNIPASGITGLNLSQIGTGSYTASISDNKFKVNTDSEITGSLTVTGVISGNGSGLTNIPASGITGLNLSRVATGSVSASVNIGETPFQVSSGSSTLAAVSSSGYVTASGFLGDGSRLSGVAIPYTNTGDRITSIEVADFDTNVAVTFVGGNLKFVFGTPVPAAITSFTLSGFATDRFNAQNDNYDVIGNWANNGYTLISASIYTGSVTLTTVGVGSSLSTNLTTSGSQSYRLAVTSSNPLDSSIVAITTTVNGTLSKSRPNVPTLTITGNTVQLGIASNQIEEGGTGDISFSAAYGSANAWEEVSLTTSPSTSPQNVLATGTVTISATSNYQSPSGVNIPQIFDNRTTTNTYTRIRSLRYGADTAASFTEAELQNLALWDTGLGGTIGTIAKGTTNPSGQSVTITWTGDKYHYIVYDSARANLSNITTGGFGVLSAFSVTTVGNYKVYRTNTLQAGGAGTSITYVLT
jgi:hypothetical protein